MSSKPVYKSFKNNKFINPLIYKSNKQNIINKFDKIENEIKKYNLIFKPEKKLQEKLIQTINNNVEYCNSIKRARNLNEYYENNIKNYKLSKGDKKVKFLNNVSRIKKMDEDMQMKLVQLDIEYVRYIDNIHINVQKYVISKCIYVAIYMNNIDTKLQKYLIECEPNLIRYIKKPNLEIIALANKMIDEHNKQFYKCN